jgi:hypothetical protein
MLGDKRAKSWKAEHLALRVVSLYQTLAIEKGCLLDTSNTVMWVLRIPDETAAAYFSAWSGSREAVERATREDHRGTRPRHSRWTLPHSRK